MSVITTMWPNQRISVEPAAGGGIAVTTIKLAVEVVHSVCYRPPVSPTVFRFRRYRFYFFSREEPRMHVHVISPDGEAKFWLEPQVGLAVNKGFKTAELNELRHIIEDRQDEIREHWRRHFAG